MKTFKPMLSGKGFLAASVALMSSTVLAETAGRVSFVTGDVTATASNGDTRILRRGDTINGGDKISTRAGRLQIRFTDGGFVSLQPNSVFGVDEYLYTNRKPEESSLFFSLLQGGMRTITGVIGKVNKQSYKVRTPVATIGIRGTGYRARLDDNGGLLVSVGSGFVHVENDGGSITAGAGQNISIPGAASSPRLTDETADVAAAGVNGDQEASEEEQEQERLASESGQDGEGQRTVAVTDLQDEDGYRDITVSDVTGEYALSTNPSLSDGIVNHPNYEDPTGGGYVDLYLASPSFQGFMLGKTLVINAQGGLDEIKDDSGNILFKRGGMSYSAPLGQNGGLIWGALFANTGTPEQDSVFQYGQPLSPASLAWIAGTPVPSDSYSAGSATYSLRGGHVTNSAGVSGTIDYFYLTYYFGIGSEKADVDLQVTVANEGTGSGNIQYTATGSNVVDSALDGIILDPSGMTTSSTDGLSCSGGCTTHISGFFSGLASAQIGASFMIDAAPGYGVAGVAALGKDVYTPPLSGLVLPNSVLDDPQNPNSPYSPTYSFLGLHVDNNGLLTTAPYQLAGRALFDQGTGLSRGVLTEFGNSNGTSFQIEGLVAQDIGTVGDVSWGRFISGATSNASVFGMSGGSDFASNTSHMAYIIGTTPDPVQLPSMGVMTFAYDPNSNHGAFKGMEELQQMEITFNFSFSAISLDMAVKASSVVYNITTNGFVGISGIGGNTLESTTFKIDSSALTTTKAGSSCPNCAASFSGFFAGTNADQLGVSFALLDGAPLFSGVTVLGAGSPSGSGIPESGYSVAYSTYNGSSAFAGDDLRGDGMMNSSQTLAFDASDALMSSTDAYMGSITLDRKALQTVDKGETPWLRWGRWYNETGSVLVPVGVGGNDIQMGANDALHYIAGAKTHNSVIYDGLYNGFEAIYAYTGGTEATDNYGNLGSLSGQIKAKFETSGVTLGVDMTVGMYDGTSYHIETNSSSLISAYGSAFSASLGSPDVTGTGGACSSTVCSADLSGFFAGAQAQQIGLAYRITDDAIPAGSLGNSQADSFRQINGVAAFGRGDFVSAGTGPGVGGQ